MRKVRRTVPLPGDSSMPMSVVLRIGGLGPEVVVADAEEAEPDRDGGAEEPGQNDANEDPVGEAGDEFDVARLADLRQAQPDDEIVRVVLVTEEVAVNHHPGEGE